MMKPTSPFGRWKKAVEALSLLMLLGSSAQAGPSTKSPFGVGLELPVVFLPARVGANLSGKYWLNSRNAWDMSLGGGPGWLGLGGDYLWHRYNVFDGEGARRAPVYYGFGGYAVLADRFSAGGVQAKGGITYLFKAPWDVFVEAVPRINLLGGLAFGIGLNLGGRFYF